MLKFTLLTVAPIRCWDESTKPATAWRLYSWDEGKIITNVIDSVPELEWGCMIHDAFCPVDKQESGVDAAPPATGVDDCVVIIAEATDSPWVKLLYDIV